MSVSYQPRARLEPQFVTTSAQRGFWLYVAAFTSFVAFVAANILGDADRQSAQARAAEQLGVAFGDLPPELIAEILRDHPTSGPVYALMVAALCLAVGLYAAGTWTLAGVAGPRSHPLTVAGTVCALAGLPAFLALAWFESQLARDPSPTWVVDNWSMWWLGSLAAFMLLETAALVLVVARIWPTGLARRTSLAVIAVAVVLAVLAVSAAAPPIIPLLLAVIFAFALRKGLARTSPA